ncbi:MAG: hydroxyethylthiazole kinase [Neomegalonema sp.]|nr:hydroxyethylthiazole kinase [Neomegalonema sp.]
MQPSLFLTPMRQAAPLVHNITNYVAMNVMANVLLAAGASPAMVHAREEASEFAGIASALTINIGTLSPEWVTAMLQAADAARGAGKPWVFDPVAAGATAYRRKESQLLLEKRPAIIRGNASEILVLAGEAGAGKGVDAADSVAAAQDAAQALAQSHGCVVIATGQIDFVTDGARTAAVRNGHEMMPRVTALGCALTGIVGAFAAVAKDPFEASVAALAYYGVAGELAGRSSRGPGSFAVAFLDALMAVDGATLDANAKIDLR